MRPHFHAIIAIFDMLKRPEERPCLACRASEPTGGNSGTPLEDGPGGGGCETGTLRGLVLKESGSEK